MTGRDSKFEMQISSPFLGPPICLLVFHFAFSILHVAIPAVSAQQLLDRIVARVDGYAITLTDVNAAVALGVIDAPSAGDQQVATERLIERELVLAEVARFAPPEPEAGDVEREVAAMKARAGGRLAAVMQATGLDEQRIRDMARDTLRIQAYLNQRFGITTQVSDEEVARYYRVHPEEFTRGATLLPFVEAEPAARQRAAAERRAALIAQWLRDLRARADITRPAARP